MRSRSSRPTTEAARRRESASSSPARLSVRREVAKQRHETVGHLVEGLREKLATVTAEDAHRRGATIRGHDLNRLRLCVDEPSLDLRLRRARAEANEVAQHAAPLRELADATA